MTSEADLLRVENRRTLFFPWDERHLADRIVILCLGRAVVG